MKSLIFLGLVVSATAFAGGVSGGGGNTKPLHPVTPKETENVIREARIFASSYFSMMQEMPDNFWQGNAALKTKLYAEHNSVVDKILDLPITIQRRGACRDQNGRAHDGSAGAGKNPFVCLSLPRLTKKLSRENIDSQIFGLAVHEFSHLVGTTEKEAEALQTMAVDYFLASDPKEFRHKIWGTDANLKEWAERYAMLPPPEENNPYYWQNFRTEVEMALSVFKEIFYDPFGSNGGMELSLWEGRMHPYSFMTYARIGTMGTEACALIPGREQADCQKQLDEFFRNDQEIDFAEFFARSGEVVKPGDYPADLMARKYRRVVDPVSAVVEWRRVSAEFQSYRDFLRGLYNTKETQ